MTASVGSKTLPCYLVLDTSTSMTDFEEQLNETLFFLYDQIALQPAVSEFAHLSIVSFNTQPHVVLELSDVGLLSSLPEVKCGGLTNYGVTFSLLRTRIDEDVTRLRSEGRSVLRPVVFFLTDGAPSDADWSIQLNELRSSEWPRHPHIISYGFGTSRAKVLQEIATVAAFQAEPGVDNSAALSNALSNMLKSVIGSAQAEKLTIAQEVEGYTSLPIEYMS